MQCICAYYAVALINRTLRYFNNTHLNQYPMPSGYAVCSCNQVAIRSPSLLFFLYESKHVEVLLHWPFKIKMPHAYACVSLIIITVDAGC